VGIDAVTNATMAVCHARFFLAGDNLDLRLQPEFVTTEKGGTELTAVKMRLSVTPMTAADAAAVAAAAPPAKEEA
jgi:stage V sporulation protein SpoVS